MAFTTTAIIPESDFTTPRSATWSMARQRLPELQPDPPTRLTTGLTNGSRRPAVLIAFSCLLLSALLSWTATVAGAAALLLPLASILAATGTATGLLVNFAEFFDAGADLNGSAFTGTATNFEAPLLLAGFAETTATCAVGTATGLAGTATATGFAEAAALVCAAGTATGFTIGCAGTETTFTPAGEGLELGAGVLATAFAWLVDLTTGFSTTVGVCAKPELAAATSKSARVRFIRSCLWPLPELRRADHG